METGSQPRQQQIASGTRFKIDPQPITAGREIVAQGDEKGLAAIYPRAGSLQHRHRRTGGRSQIETAASEGPFGEGPGTGRRHVK